MVAWPDNRSFAFSIFDDPDGQTVENGRDVYALLADCGLCITKGVWPVRGPRTPSDPGLLHIKLSRACCQRLAHVSP